MLMKTHKIKNFFNSIKRNNDQKKENVYRLQEFSNEVCSKRKMLGNV